MNLPNFDAMYKDMAAGLPKSVKCSECGRKLDVDPELCLRYGWPKCCGYTMSLDRASAVKGYA
jgi:hypothetical protein